MKKTTILGIVFVVGLIAAFLVWKWTYRPSIKDVSAEKAEYTIGTSELLNHFETDEVTANEKFLDKTIIVKGVLDNVEEDSLYYTLYLKNPGEIAGVLCSFDKSILDIKKVAQGDSIKVKGICSGYLLDVIMNKCSLEK